MGCSGTHDYNTIQRIRCIVVDGEMRAYWRHGQGVGELTGVPAMVGEVRRDVVVDGGSSGTSGVSGDGVNLRRASAAAHGLR